VWRRDGLPNLTATVSLRRRRAQGVQPVLDLDQRPGACPPLPRLLNHLVGRSQQRFRDGEAESVGGFEVDDQFEFSGLKYGQVACIFTI
jgi:hypothetical protein